MAPSALSRFLAKLPFKSPWKVRPQGETQESYACARARVRQPHVDRAPRPHALSPLSSSPLQVTGVASSPEFQTYLPLATEYRKHAPA